MSGSLRVALFSTTAIIGFSLDVPAIAQPAQDTTAATPAGLEEVVVTARRREEVLQTTPVSVSALSGSTLDRLDIRGIDQVAKFIPNIVSVPTVGFIGGATTSIRGIGEHDILITEDSPIGQYVDGVYIAGPTSTNFDLVAVQRIEVLRGPQGTLFGRNTTGGAINIVTKKPSDEFGFEEKFSYGSYNDTTARTELNTGEIGSTGLKAIIAYQHRQRDGYVNNVNQPGDKDPGALNSDAVWVKLHGDWDALSADYSFDYDRIGGVTPYGQISYVSPAVAAYYAQSPKLGGSTLVVDPNRLQNVSLQPVPDDRIGMLGHALTLQYDLAPDLSLKSITGYRQFWSQTYVPYAPPGLLGPTVTGIAPVTPYEGPTGQRLLQYSEELQILGSSDRWNYVGGLYYFHDRTNENEFANLTFLLSPTLGFNTTSSTIAQLSSTSEAIFGQASYRPPIADDKFELTGGLRFTRDSKSIEQSQPIVNIATRHFYDLSYNVTLNYQLTDTLMAYARISTGYRSGGFNLRAQAGQNLDFAPEDAQVYEAGIKSEWFEHRLRANLSGFYTDYSNLQVSQFTGVGAGGGAAGIKNANADYSGFELEVQAKPIESVTIDGSIGYTHPEYQQIFFPDPVTGGLKNYAATAHFPYVPEWTNHIGVQYEFPPLSFGRLTLRGDYSYQSTKYFFTTDLPTQNPFNDLIKSPDQNLVSARLTLSDVPVWNGKATMEASLWGENLLNSQYLIQGVDFGPSLGFATKAYGMPRTIGFDLKLKY
jgi:iron complex outermembrane recepter protein